MNKNQLVEDRKHLIKNAAAKVLAKEGFYNAKMQSVADEAGIAIGTVYLYFKSKEEILDYIFKVELEKRLDFVRSLENTGETPLQQIKSLLLFHVAQLKNDSDTARILIQESGCPCLKKLEWVGRTFIDLPRIISNLLECAKEQGEIKDIDTDIAGAMIFFSSRAMAYKMQLEGRESEYEYAVDQLFSVILDGIKK